ncbi:MAG: fatty acid desaturase [Bacteroidota bacterium]
MSVTNNLKVREVINQVVNDPEYKRVAAVPLFSGHQLGLIALAYGGVFGGMALYWFAGVSLWIVYPIMAFCFYTAFTPLHDATHRAVSSNNRLNDFLGTLSGTLLFPFANTTGYRYLHLAHHRYVGDKELDPDEPMVAIPTLYFPFGYLVLLFPDFLWAYWLLVKAWKRTPVQTRFSVLVMILGNVLFHVAWFLSPFAYEYLILFFIPNRIAIAYTALTFAHTPHPEGLSWNDHPFQATVQLKVDDHFGWSLYGQRHHAMHHFLPHVPWYNYFKVWDLANGAFRRQEIPEKELFAKPDPHFKDQVLQEKVAAADTILLAQVTAIHEAAPGIKTFYFTAPPSAPPLPPFTAGAHINITLPSGKVRSYSCLNAPYEEHCYQIAVKLEANGQGGSREMHEQVQVGDVLEISHPQNNFVLYENVKQYILISGGIGITPLLSMAHRLTEIEKHFELHVCAKLAEEIPFRFELQNWTFAPNVEIHLDEAGKSSIDLSKVLASPEQDTLVYVCGPAGFNKWIKEQALTLGWTKDQIKQEVFSRTTPAVTDSQPFELVLNKSGKTITVQAEETIIDALHHHNIEVAYSCLQGTCGTCVSPVLAGAIDHRDAVLSEEEKQEGQKMCLCVSRALGGQVVLDL